MAHSEPLKVVELSKFEKAAAELFTAAEKQGLLEFVVSYPESGQVIAGTGGMRKLRWSSKGRGKRGGARVVYYHYVHGQTIFFATAYEKNRKEDLSHSDKKALKKLVEWLHNKESE